MKDHLLIRRLAAAFAALGAVLAIGVTAAHAANYVPGEVVVGYAPGLVPRAVTSRLGIRSVAASPAPGVQVFRLSQGVSVSTAVGRLRALPGVAYAVPNYVAHAAGS